MRHENNSGGPHHLLNELTKRDEHSLLPHAHYLGPLLVQGLVLLLQRNAANVDELKKLNLSGNSAKI